MPCTYGAPQYWGWLGWSADIFTGPGLSGGDGRAGALAQADPPDASPGLPDHDGSEQRLIDVALLLIHWGYEPCARARSTPTADIN